METRQATQEEQLEFIYNYERTFVIPLKIAMIILVTVLTSAINRDVFGNPRFYNGYIVAAVIALLFTFYFYTTKDLKHLKLVSYLSFAHDIAVATYFLQFTGGRVSVLHFAYAMYFIRAAISYPTMGEILFTGLIIFTPIYFFGVYYAEHSILFLEDRQFYIQYGFMWGIIISCFGVVSLLNRQKEKIKKQLKEISALQEQLIQSEKLAGLGQLAGGVAHELNNPLGTILGFSEMIMKECSPDDPKRRDLGKIEKGALRCKKIIDSLLSFSRQSKSEKSYVRINKAIEDTLALCQYELEERGIDKKVSLDPNLPATYAEGGQLQQVFMNLFLNAMDAMDKKGTLTVQTKSVKAEQGDEIQVIIKDTGLGIPKEAMPRIFDPFFTTKEVGRGTGLGLSIVYGIIQRHHGSVTVESEPGKGTEFVIRLPVIKKVAKEEEEVYA